MSSASASSNDPRVDPDGLRDLAAEILGTFGVPDPHAVLTADVLVAADLAGVDSHGVSRLSFYAHKLGAGLVNPRPEPTVVVDSGAGVVIDGDNGLGPVASQLAMDTCLDRAREGVLAMATVVHGNHYGIAQYWSRQALERGMIGVSMTNATALVAPTFGHVPMLGTNPISVAVPAGDEPPFVLDMATSAVPAGKLELALAAGEAVPEGWVIDEQGRASTDPAAGFAGALLPLGSTRERGSHKGYGLAVVVDVLSAVLSGAAWGPHCLSLTSEFDSVANVGHCFMALRVDAFRPLEEFEATMDEMIRSLRATPPAPGEGPVLVAGDPERACEEDRRRNGIPLASRIRDDLHRLATERGLDEKRAEVLSGPG